MACENIGRVQWNMNILFLVCAVSLPSFCSELTAQGIAQPDSPALEWYAGNKNTVAVIGEDGEIEIGNRLNSTGVVEEMPVGTFCPQGMISPPPHCVPIITTGGGPCTESMCQPGVGMAGNFDAITGRALSEIFLEIDSSAPVGQ